jgi:FtsZ-binding cell division protein ZapB
LSAISEEPDEDKDDDELLGEIHTLKEQINIPETSTQDTPKDETHRPKDRNNIYKEGYYDLKGKFDSLTYELAPMRVMYDRLISDNEILKEERAILAQENVGLKGENVILKGEVMNSKHENELLRREIQQLRNAHDVQVRHRKLGISDDASPVGDYDVARVGDEARERGVLVGDWEAVEPAIPEIRLTTH